MKKLLLVSMLFVLVLSGCTVVQVDDVGKLGIQTAARPVPVFVTANNFIKSDDGELLNAETLRLIKATLPGGYVLTEDRRHARVMVGVITTYFGKDRLQATKLLPGGEKDIAETVAAVSGAGGAAILLGAGKGLLWLNPGTGLAFAAGNQILDYASKSTRTATSENYYSSARISIRVEDNFYHTITFSETSISEGKQPAIAISTHATATTVTQLLALALQPPMFTSNVRQ
ncbi:hypothetical protein MJO47_06355 [Desulfuromonas sp. KJ2020]|uniref:hypothetical protein n=1 Tax=Desulfuromonas sp. KJ2020 TaxID=2919173 RepID=UPI0020A7E383|nr:hypothetical protein [Desulfuromonas sp. KJ2020]MCP3176719.1 hypothetical protein [Desulfuromonas sp. KJ2020]